jgi:hypothetical protein
MEQYVAILYSLICKYLLDQRDSNIAILKQRLEMNQVTQEQAYRYLPKIRELIEEVIRTGNYLPAVPTRETYESQGKPEIELGDLIEVPGVRFGDFISNRWPSTIITGISGSGKTVTKRGLIKKIQRFWNSDPGREWISMIIFDSKGDYLDLPHEFGDVFKCVSINSGCHIGLNGFDVVPDGIWTNALTRSLAARLGLIGSRTTFASVIHWVLPILNPEPVQGTLRYPSLRLILQVLRQATPECFSTRSDYTKWLVQQLTGLLQDSGELFDTFNGLELNRDIIEPRKHLIINIANLPDYLRHLVIDLFILQVMVPRLHRGLKHANQTGVLFLIDEADLLLKSEGCYTDGLSPLSQAIRQMREEKVMITLGVSALENVPQQILIDARDFIIFNMGKADSVALARKTLQIDPRCDQMISSLLPGHCLVRSLQSGWTSTVYGVVDFVPPPDNRIQVVYDPNAYVLAQGLDELPEVRQALIQREAELKAQKQRQRQQAKSTDKALANPVTDFLAIASMNPLEPVHQIFIKMEITSGSARKTIQDELKKAGLIRFVPFSIGRKSMLLFEITEAGWTYLKKTPPTGLGRGKVEHRFMCHQIHRKGEQQKMESHLELAVPGTSHIADVAWKTPEGWIFFEYIGSTYENLMHHIQETFDSAAQVKELIIVASTQKKLETVRHYLEGLLIYQTYASKITFQTIEPYMEETL